MNADKLYALLLGIGLSMLAFAVSSALFRHQQQIDELKQEIENIKNSKCFREACRRRLA